jgi:hypothetical protein
VHWFAGFGDDPKVQQAATAHLDALLNSRGAQLGGV